MTTFEERCEVARRLREIKPNKEGCVEWWQIAQALKLKEIRNWFGWEKFEPDSAKRLADLIEPSCDHDTPQKVAEEMFGKMRHSTKEEADAYEAMLKSKSVEIHPVDRDALLKVADMLECDGECSECECGKGTFCEAPTIAAARIREALGENQ